MSFLFDFREDPFLASFMVIVCVFFSLFILDAVGASAEVVRGEVHEMAYSQGNQSTTVGMAYTNNGVAPVVATTGHPNEWSLIVKTSDGFLKIDCSLDQFYSHKAGDQVKIKRVYGWLSGVNYDNKIKE